MQKYVNLILTTGILYSQENINFQNLKVIANNLRFTFQVNLINYLSKKTILLINESFIKIKTKFSLYHLTMINLNEIQVIILRK